MARRRENNDASSGLNLVLFGPQSTWSAPKEFPDLSGEKVIGLDIESRDPKLREWGPGFIRGDAEVVGVSVATSDRGWYFPIGHLGGGNLDRGQVSRFVGDLVSRKDRFICGANLQYELEGLDVSLGIEVKSKLLDVQIAEALIDEESESGYSLDALSAKYLKTGKDESLLREAAAAYGLDPKKSLWKMPACVVGPYAEFDAMAPIKIFNKQLLTLKSEKLEEIFQLESELLPILYKMRRRGIRMNIQAAKELSGRLAEEEQKLRKSMRDKWGAEIDEWSGGVIAMVCDKHGIRYPRTARGNPSFVADFIESANHPFFDDLSDLRELNKMRITFIDGWVLDNAVGDRVHPQWRQNASDEGGTRTGRMAASNPNPQQVPAGKYRKTGKPNEFGKLIRALFIPHLDELKWMKCDYDQQEPRILIHFANLCKCTGADVPVLGFQQGGYLPKGEGGYDLYKPLSLASGLDMRPTKDCYLGRCYGMGYQKLAYKFNKTVDEAKEILRKFDDAAPYIKEVADICTRSAADRGYIKTLLGRRRHFNLYEPAEYGRMQPEEAALKYDLAVKTWGPRVKRSGTHKALNALIQGSAADMTKAAMVQIYNKYGEFPYMQVHDELNFGIRDEEHGRLIHHEIQHCVEMTVPVVSKMEIGDHWK